MAHVIWTDYPAVAYHVAAHIVMQLHLDRRVYYASIEPREGHGRCTDGELEGVRDKSRGIARTRVAVEHDALYRIAGRVFEKQCLRSSPWYSETKLTRLADEDRTAVREALHPLGLTHDALALSLQYVERRAAGMLETKETIYRVTRFAQALVQHDHLSEKMINELSRAIDALFLARQQLRPSQRLSQIHRVVSQTTPTLRPSPLQLPGESFEFRSPTRQLDKVRKTRTTTRAQRRGRAADGAPSNRSLTELGLSNLALNTLQRRGGITTIDMLLTYSEERLLGIRTLGAKTLQEIRRALQRAGMALSE